MKRYLILPLLLCALTPLRAQTEVDLDPELGGRFAVGIDKKVARGLHLHLEEEVRLDNNFSSLDRLHTSLGATYKLHPNIRIGLGYSLINPYSSSNSAFKGARHRLAADATGILHLGQWNISLKERLQMTLRTGDYNAYQSPGSAIALKSRLGAKYKGWQHKGISPYTYVELRTTFSAPLVTATYIGDGFRTQYSQTSSPADTVGDPGWFLDGFHGVHVDRLRACIGMDYRLSRSGTLTFYLIADRTREKVIDANKKGTKLFSYSDEHGSLLSLGVGYTVTL